MNLRSPTLNPSGLLPWWGTPARAVGGWAAVPPVTAAPAPRGIASIWALLLLVALGILAAIALPKFGETPDLARVTAAQAQISTLGSMLDVYEADNGAYPTTGQGLRALLARPGSTPGWKGPYLKSDEVPKDPWGNDYIYTSPGIHNPASYDLVSAGPNGRLGGGDDVANWTRP